MLRCKNGPLLLCLAALGCSGRYEVGEMDPAEGGSSSSAGSTASAAGGTFSAGGGASGGKPTSGGSAPKDCFSAVAPARLNAPFVAPQQVYSRILPFVWGEEEPVSAPELPSEMSYEGAGELVDDAFASAMTTGRVPGGDFFVRHWLGLESSVATLEGDYGASMGEGDTTLLEALLLPTWATGRTGVFSEQAWLAQKASIPARGHDIALNIFGISIPPPPPSIDLSVDSTLQDRAAIEAAINSPACAACHQLFTPLGYSLGHFDRAGEYRESDHNLPIDATGSYQVPGGGPVLNFDGIRDLSLQMATTCEANLAIVDRFLHVALTVRGYDVDSRYAAIEANRDRVRRAFIARGRTYHALVRAFAQSPLVLY